MPEIRTDFCGGFAPLHEWLEGYRSFTNVEPDRVSILVVGERMRKNRV